MTTVTVPGQGRYVLDTTQGLVTFTPEPGFTGTPQPVRYRVTDAYGQASEARYQPEVVAGSDTGTPTTTTTPAETAPAPAQPGARRTTVPATACLSRRTMTLNWRVSPTRRLRSIRIAVTGRPTLRLSGRARRATVDLRGRVRETVRVRVIARTTTGRTLSTTRTYHPCRARMAHAPLPTLTLRPQR